MNDAGGSVPVPGRSVPVPSAPAFQTSPPSAPASQKRETPALFRRRLAVDEPMNHRERIAPALFRLCSAGMNRPAPAVGRLQHQRESPQRGAVGLFIWDGLNNRPRINPAVESNRRGCRVNNEPNQTGARNRRGFLFRLSDVCDVFTKRLFS